MVFPQASCLRTGESRSVAKRSWWAEAADRQLQALAALDRAELVATTP